MVKITNVNYDNGSVIIEFLSNGITISTKVDNTDGMIPSDIIKVAYESLMPHIDMECNRQGFESDHTLPEVDNPVIGVELMGVENLQFTEGQQPITKTYRCVARTLYGEKYEADAEFIPSKTEVIEVKESESRLVKVYYKGFIDNKSYSVNYKSLADIEAEKVIAEIPVIEVPREPTYEERLARIELLLDLK